VRVAWLTDIHLNFLRPGERRIFFDRLAKQNFDAVLVGGDIGEGQTVASYLAAMADALRVPIYFVLGNHDFYHSSIASTRSAVASQAAASPNLHYLSESGVVSLTATTALVGHDSWADGRLGDFFGSSVMLNDYVLIADFEDLYQKDRFTKLNSLGDEAAAFLEARALEALASHQHVVVLTHVPPFREACWHEGRISDDDWIPHFGCRAVGERLATVARAHPEQSVTVLCGHTHSPGVAQILPNLVVYTGAAEYGKPIIQRVFEF
jgi:predicted MPP superfamily phosphohydrolase